MPVGHLINLGTLFETIDKNCSKKDMICSHKTQNQKPLNDFF